MADAIYVPPSRETLGAKLRRLAANAAISNPLINPPWNVPSAWASGTAYVIGNVVNNGGHYYMCVIAGTSAGSGGPTSTTTGQIIADNTVSWTYMGSATVSGADALAPTVTTSSAGTPTGLTNWFGPVAIGNVFHVTGSYSETYATNYWNINTFNTKAATTVKRGGEIRFETDAPKFAVGFTNGAPAVRIVVDDRYLNIANMFQTSGTPNWFVVDWSTVGGRKRRSVVVEGSKSGMNFAGVRATSLDMVWKPSTEDDVTVAFISDSIIDGSSYGPFLAGGMVHQRIGKLLGWKDCWSFATGGTGYVNTGTSSYYTYGQRITEALTRNPDLWVFFGSTNDIGLAGVQAAALAAFQAVRAESTAPIIVFGLWPLNNAGVSATESSVSAAVTQFDDPLGKTFFIPIYADPVLPWVTGAWNNTANTSSTNATLMISGDNVHPAESGTIYIAERMARAIKENVLTSLR